MNILWRVPFLIFSLEYPTGRFLRDARLYTVGAGSQEIRRLLIGREFNNDYKS